MLSFHGRKLHVKARCIVEAFVLIPLFPDAGCCIFDGGMISRAISSLSWRRDFRGLMVFAVLAAVGWLCWKGARDPAIPLLPPGPANWIIYPSPPHAKINSDKVVSAEFARQLVLASAPTSAEIRWRAFRRSEFSINGLAIAATGDGNWKDTVRLNVVEKSAGRDEYDSDDGLELQWAAGA